MLMNASVLRTLSFVALIAIGLSLGLDAFAQTATATASAFAEGFVPVPGGQPNTENVDASLLVVLAYAAFAVGFIAYLVFLSRRQASLSQEMAELALRIDRSQD